MPKILAAAFATTLILLEPAHADMFCVQRGLNNLGYEAGTVDGLFGRRTATASEQFSADFGVQIEPLTAETSAAWCAPIRDAQSTPEGIARRFDVTSRPEGVLSGSQTDALWNAYKTAPACFEHPTYGAGTSFALERIQPAELSSIPWKDPFPSGEGVSSCSVSAAQIAPAPAPIPVISLDEEYGNSQIEAEQAMAWFFNHMTLARYSNDTEARQTVKQALLDWAQADSLDKGIRVSWGNQPVDYSIIALIMALTTATAEILPDLTENEKTIIGPWLNGLVAEAANSRWKDRQDNKAYMKAYLGLVWGIVVGDDAAVQEGIDTFKLAIHDMRPDGSFPIDTQRSGMGIQYNATSAAHLVQIAAAVRQNFGLDLFDYEIDGRSGHSMVDFVVRSMREPGATNAIYAISCPDGGDRWGDISQPSTHFITDASYLLVYADMFPDSEHVDYIRTRLASSLRSAQFPEHTGGAPACQYAGAFQN